MTIDHAARLVQVAFPQVYLACHTRHQRKRSTEHRLSQRDAAILAHLDPRRPLTVARLAIHLGVAKSTLSAALKHLAGLGYVCPPPGVASAARFASGVVLTAQGMDAIRDTSVLETARLEQALAGLGSRERRLVAAGLSTLARACREASERARGRRSAA